MTVDSALQLATVWACIRLLAETISTLPLPVYRRNSKGQPEAAPDHPLYPLLHDQPNADMTAVNFWECVVACLCLWGDSYSEKSFVGQRIAALTPMRPDLTRPFRRENGRICYAYSDPDGYRELDEDQVLHIKGFGIDGLKGLSPIGYARNSLGAAMATDEASSRVFANGLKTSGFVEVDKILKPDQRKQIEDMLTEFTGSGNAGRVMVLEAGFNYKQLTLPPEDAQMLQTRAFQVEEICRWFRVPPFMIGHTEKSTSWGTGLEQQMIGFLTFALRPYLTRIEQAVKKSLIVPAERGRVFAEFNLEGLLRADSQGRAALYNAGADHGWLKRNEIRRKENLPPEPGGEMLTVQSNMVPLDQLGRVASEQQVQAIAAAVVKAMMGHNGGPPLDDETVEKERASDGQA
ncbi:phage portal protein [Inquilinus sp. CA228]|uniref:phage portal protein n=1 Tax=Inquilinus sp. CA228 TaxID=3455609 RepID=UPI003F8D2247